MHAAQVCHLQVPLRQSRAFGVAEGTTRQVERRNVTPPAVEVLVAVAGVVVSAGLGETSLATMAWLASW